MFRGRVSTFGGVALLCFYLLTGAMVTAQAQSLMSGGIIKEIRIEGVQRIEPETVLG